MAKEDFNQVSASFEAVQCILSSILCPSIFRPIKAICRHFNSSLILCLINATSSSSYVFRLQCPRVLHCRIVLIEKLKTKNLPQQIQDRNKNKSFESHAHLRENSSTGGGRIFSRNVVRHHSNSCFFTKYIVFIVFYDLKIKIKNNKYLRIFIINHNIQ